MRAGACVLGQLFEGAVALASPEDPDDEAGQQRARIRDQRDPVQREARQEDVPGEESAAPGAAAGAATLAQAMYCPPNGASQLGFSSATTSYGVRSGSGSTG